MATDTGFESDGLKVKLLEPRVEFGAFGFVCDVMDIFVPDVSLPAVPPTVARWLWNQVMDLLEWIISWF